MQNPKNKVFSLIGSAVIVTIIITLPMRLLLDQYQSSEQVEIIYTPFNQ